MDGLKPITAAGVEAAITKAEHYRLLNDPTAAESICLDVLELEPANQRALVTLLLARTDQFARPMAAKVTSARDVLPRLEDPYARAYYAGLIAERRGTALLHARTPAAGPMAYACYREAMGHYAEAERLRPAGNDDALLRWNTCVRLLEAHAHVTPGVEESYEPVIGE